MSMSRPQATAANRSSEPSVDRDARAGEAGGFGFHNVLVGVDGTSTGRDAIALAAQLRDRGGRMTLAHVVLPQSLINQAVRPSLDREEAATMLERERDAFALAGELAEVFAPSVGGGLRELAEERRADLLVVGSSARRGIGRLLRGDDTRESLTGATCPVAVAPRGYREHPREIATVGVAYDGTPESDAALAVARGLAADHGAALRAVTVVWPTGWSAATAARWALTLDAEEQAASNRLQSLAGVEGNVSVGPPEQELRLFSNEVDLLVVGSRGHGPGRRLVVGSTSAELAQSARRPILIVPRTAIVVPEATDEP